MFKTIMLLCGGVALACAADSADRGKYLVEEVARCQDCHTPSTENGAPDRANWLKGTTLNFAPTKEVKGWHKTSPDLTPGGRMWQRWGEDNLVKFLETAKGPKGNEADPPMPAYHLTHEDARAVVDYLKTLK